MLLFLYMYLCIYVSVTVSQAWDQILGEVFKYKYKYSENMKYKIQIQILIQRVYFKCKYKYSLKVFKYLCTLILATHCQVIQLSNMSLL